MTPGAGFALAMLAMVAILIALPALAGAMSVWEALPGIGLLLAVFAGAIIFMSLECT